MEEKRLTSLSPSRASDFKHCPALYKFRSIDKLEEPPTVHQARGTTAHRALELLFDLPPGERNAPRLYDLFRRAWVELRDVEFPGLFSTVEEERAWGMDSMALLANYFAVEDPARIRPTARERVLEVDVDGMTIRGILDRMEEDGGRLIITDYKTGKAPPERYAIGAFFALKIYALLVRREMGQTPDELRLLYLNGPTVYTIPVNDAQLDAMERHLRALWSAIDRAIRTGDFPTRPGRLCDWCAFQDRCPAWTTAPSLDELAASPA